MWSRLTPGGYEQADEVKANQSKYANTELTPPIPRRKLTAWQRKRR
jgi:hypothetical protein